MKNGQNSNSSDNDYDSDKSTVVDASIQQKITSNDAEIAKLLQEEENQRPKRARQKTARLVFADPKARSYPVSSEGFVPPATQNEIANLASNKKTKKAKRIELTEGLEIEPSDYIAIEKDGEKLAATVIESDADNNDILVCYDSGKWETLSTIGLNYSHYPKQASPETLTFNNPETGDVYKIYKGKREVSKLKSKAGKKSNSPDLDMLAKAAATLEEDSDMTTDPTAMPTVAFTPINIPNSSGLNSVAAPSVTLTTTAPLLFTQPEKPSDYDAEIAKHEAVIAAQLAKVAELKKLRENAIKAEQEKAQNLADVREHIKLYADYKMALEQINIATSNLSKTKAAILELNANFYQKNNMNAIYYAKNNSDSLYNEFSAIIAEVKASRQLGNESLNSLKGLIGIAGSEVQASSSSSSSSRDLTSQYRLGL